MIERFNYRKVHLRKEVERKDNATVLVNDKLFHRFPLGFPCGAADSLFDQSITNAFSAALSRIASVERLNCTICCSFILANRRVTVSREVPIICAISSWGSP